MYLLYYTGSLIIAFIDIQKERLKKCISWVNVNCGKSPIKRYKCPSSTLLPIASTLPFKPYFFSDL